MTTIIVYTKRPFRVRERHTVPDPRPLLERMGFVGQPDDRQDVPSREVVINWHGERGYALAD